jgi:hypothetical protein
MSVPAPAEGSVSDTPKYSLAVDKDNKATECVRFAPGRVPSPSAHTSR